MKVYPKICCILILVIGILLSPKLVIAEIRAEQSKNTIYFYNPETNINNYASLKYSFDIYLSNFGDYQFQPFNNKDIFENSFSKNNHGIYLLSSWHYQYLPSDIKLQPVMVGVSNGKSTQKKILSVNQSITDISLLKGTTIACSGSEKYTINLLKEMLEHDNSDILPTLNFILVPKDIDALLAVVFGMATAALTSERSLDNFKKINKKQYQSLRPLMESQQYFLTLAAIPQTENKNAAELLDILEKMGINPGGEIRLRMLGLDGWRRLTRQEKLVLKQQGHKGL